MDRGNRITRGERLHETARGIVAFARFPSQTNLAGTAVAASGADFSITPAHNAPTEIHSSTGITPNTFAYGRTIDSQGDSPQFPCINPALQILF